MILQINTTEKVIKVEETVNFGELVKVLNKLLPKGEWKTYKLETNTVINWNPNPVWTYPIYPIYPIYPNYPIYGTTGSLTTSDCVGVTTSGYATIDVTTIKDDTPFTLT